MAAVQATAVTDNINATEHVVNITVPSSLTNAVIIYLSTRASRGAGDVASDVDGAFTFVAQNGDFDRISFFILKNPTAGAHVITHTLSAGSRGRATAWVIDNVDQTTSTGTFAEGAGAGSDTSTTLTVTSSSGDIVVGAIIVPSGSEVIDNDGGETSVGGDQTWVNATSDQAFEAGIASSTPLDWSWVGSDDYMTGGLAVLDGGAAAPVVPPRSILRGITRGINRRIAA